MTLFKIEQLEYCSQKNYENNHCKARHNQTQNLALFWQYTWLEAVREGSQNLVRYVDDWVGFRATTSAFYEESKLNSAGLSRQIIIQTKQYTHTDTLYTAHTTYGGFYLDGWPQRKTIRAYVWLTQATYGALSSSNY